MKARRSDGMMTVKSDNIKDLQHVIIGLLTNYTNVLAYDITAVEERVKSKYRRRPAKKILYTLHVHDLPAFESSTQINMDMIKMAWSSGRSKKRLKLVEHEIEPDIETDENVGKIKRCGVTYNAPVQDLAGMIGDVLPTMAGCSDLQNSLFGKMHTISTDGQNAEIYIWNGNNLSDEDMIIAGVQADEIRASRRMRSVCMSKDTDNEHDEVEEKRFLLAQRRQSLRRRGETKKKNVDADDIEEMPFYGPEDRRYERNEKRRMLRRIRSRRI